MHYIGTDMLLRIVCIVLYFNELNFITMLILLLILTLMYKNNLFHKIH